MSNQVIKNMMGYGRGFKFVEDYLPYVKSSHPETVSELIKAFEEWRSHDGNGRLSSNLIHAIMVNAHNRIKSGLDRGGFLRFLNNVAIGTTSDGKIVTEYRYENGETAICALTKTGRVYAARITQDGVYRPYRIGEINSEDRDCAIFLALLERWGESYDTGKATLNAINEAICSSPLDMEVFVDRSFNNFRFVNETFVGDLGENLKFSLNHAGTPMQIKSTKVASEDYSPTIVHCGEFRIFGNANGNGGDTSTKMVSFQGKYSVGAILNDHEQQMIPIMDESWIVPKEAVKFCNLIQRTSNEIEPIRNIMLVGEAGSGKSKTAQIIAAGIGLPYVHITCSADTEIHDFIGQNMPVKEDVREKELPTITDIRLDMRGSFKKLTGADSAPEGLDIFDVIDILMQEVSASRSNNAVNFRYVDSPLIKALKYGWVCEIQEPTVISRPGVLTGLNSLLEHGGAITLPTGEVIKRHPNAVIIMTTNRDYRGCDDMNQSVISRMEHVQTMNLPDEDILINRVIARTGFKNKVMLQDMVKLVTAISAYLKEEDIKDGVCGVRELLSWVKSVKVEGSESAYDNAITCVIEKATTYTEVQEHLISTILEASIFAVNRTVTEPAFP